MRRELGDGYVQELRSIFANRIPPQADLCCYWFEKAREQIEKQKCRRVGLLATQGIRSGANNEVLRRIKETGDICATLFQNRSGSEGENWFLKPQASMRNLFV
jgi:hypothetical protein